MKNYIRDYRKKAGVTLTELASKCNVSRDMIQNLEDGFLVPSNQLINKIAEVLQCKTKDLF